MSIYAGNLSFEMAGKGAKEFLYYEAVKPVYPLTRPCKSKNAEVQKMAAQEKEGKEGAVIALLDGAK